MAKFLIYFGSSVAVIVIFIAGSYFIFQKNNQPQVLAVQNVSPEEKKEEIKEEEKKEEIKEYEEYEIESREENIFIKTLFMFMMMLTVFIATAFTFMSILFLINYCRGKESDNEKKNGDKFTIKENIVILIFQIPILFFSFFTKGKIASSIIFAVQMIFSASFYCYLKKNEKNEKKKMIKNFFEENNNY